MCWEMRKLEKTPERESPFGNWSTASSKVRRSGKANHSSGGKSTLLLRGRPLFADSSDRTRSDVLKLCHGRFGLDIWKHFFSERAVLQWHSCPCSGGGHHPWGCCVYGTEGRGQWAVLVAGGQLDWMILEVFSNFSKSMIL